MKIDEINQEIAKLESIDHLTYDICHKLSVLYIIREHLLEDDYNIPNVVSPTSTSSIEIRK